MFYLRPWLTRFMFMQREASKKVFCTSTSAAKLVENLQEFLNIPKHKAEYIVIKQPSLLKFDSEHLRQIADTIQELGIPKNDLANQPVIFTSFPNALKNRYQILKECGFDKITASTLSKYLNLIRRHTIAKLKAAKLIPSSIIVGCTLANIFTEWPRSSSTAVWNIDESKYTLLDIRMKILQRYLELILDLPEEEFHAALKRYVRIKHRPFENINETLMLLHKKIVMPNEKIRNNVFLIACDPRNIKRMLYELREIAGVDIKQVFKMRPKICDTQYDNIVEMQKVFDQYGLKNDARIRCLDIYTLSAETVRKRLERAKLIPEFAALQNNPRLLKIIHHETKALERLETLKKCNKKCFSLNILSGSSFQYGMYQKNPGDSSKGRDLVLGLADELGSKFTIVQIRTNLKRHPFWTNIPLAHAKFVYQKLATDFSSNDIFENLTVLLYPWSKIQMIIELFYGNSNVGIRVHNPELSTLFHNLDLTKLTKSQILSLIVYFMEKDHYFSGNGIWTDEKLKQIILNEEYENMVKSHQHS